jgi:hypothetical protein
MGFRLLGGLYLPSSTVPNQMFYIYSSPVFLGRIFLPHKKKKFKREGTGRNLDTLFDGRK